MTCLLTCQHMTPSTAIEGSKTFSFALCQKSLAEQCVRVVHFLGTPHTKLLRFTTWHDIGVDLISNLMACYYPHWKATNSKHSQWDTYKILFRNLLVFRFLDQDHIWWKDLIFSSEMFLDTGYWSKMFDWQFFHLIIYVLSGHKNKFL